MRRIHYCDDFSFDFQRVDQSGNVVAVPSHAWLAIIHTRISEIRASRSEDGELKGAKIIDDTTIRFIVNDHGLHPGEVVLEFFELIPDEDFPDGNRRVHSSYRTGIELVTDTEVSDEASIVIGNTTSEGKIDLSSYAKKDEVSQAVAHKADKVLVVEETATTLAIAPNVLHKWGEVTSLDITLAEPTDTSIVNEYMMEFVSGDTATTLTLPDTIKWAIEPKIEANKTYQISILDNIAVIIGV